MKVRLEVELPAQRAYELAMWLSQVKYGELPKLPAAAREQLFKDVRYLGSKGLATEVRPDEQRSNRQKDPADPERRCLLVDWACGIR